MTEPHDEVVRTGTGARKVWRQIGRSARQNQAKNQRVTIRFSPNSTILFGMRVFTAPHSIARGDSFVVGVEEGLVDGYGQIQVELFKVDTENPRPAMGTGTRVILSENGAASVPFSSADLGLGTYEVGLVRLHEPQRAEIPPTLDFIPGRDFPRAVFEVRDPSAPHHSSDQILDRLLAWERAWHERFHSPRDIRQNRLEPGDQVSALVFVKDMLVGVGMRFDSFEVIPTGKGLDSEDALRFVNSFLSTAISGGLRFEYDEATRAQSQQSTPVVVLHFPALAIDSLGQARDYCIDQANSLLLALSLSRDAGGSVFEVVLISHRSGQATRYAITPTYVGNALRGSMSGENHEQVSAYLRGVEASEFDEFLVGLYREARRERSRDFQYVRYWQILETIADSENYDPSSPLLDYEGNQMLDGERVATLRKAVHRVFNLLRSHELGDSIGTWRHVNIWNAFRNAVAHHGAISRYSELSHAPVREWARRGVAELGDPPMFDHLLLLLKEETKMILMRRLVAAGSSSGERSA